MCPQFSPIFSKWDVSPIFSQFSPNFLLSALATPLAAFGGLDQEDGLLPSSGIPHREENPSASPPGKGPKLFLTSKGGLGK